MGQNLIVGLDDLKGDVIKEAQILKELIDIGYEDFVNKVKELNNVCSSSLLEGSRRLYFCIQEGSDTTFLWKQTVRINCMRSIENNDVMEDFKLLTLRQFLLASKFLQYHFDCQQSLINGESSCSNALQNKAMSTSMILNKVTSAKEEDMEECIVCMERKPELILPCAHAYCLICIEQWNVSNKTCPVCRETLENTDDSWLTPEIPKSSEMNAEIQKAFSALTDKLNDE